MDGRLKTDDKFIQMTHDLVVGLKWLERNNLEDGDIQAIDDFMIFNCHNGNNTTPYKKYIKACHFFLDNYESDLECLNGNDWYDLVVNMYKNGYKISLKRVIDK